MKHDRLLIIMYKYLCQSILFLVEVTVVHWFMPYVSGFGQNETGLSNLER